MIPRVRVDCVPLLTCYQTAAGVGDAPGNPMAETHTAAAADTLDSADIVERLKLRMIERCLPLWSTEGWDNTAGGFIDRLDPDGRAKSLAPRRVFVQARQIYCFAKAAQMGWYPDGRAIALKGLDHLLSRAKSPDGRPGFVHTLKPDGAVLDPRRDSYDHAFVLLALASVHALDPDAQIFAPRSTDCAISSKPSCARLTAAFTKDCRRRCRGGRNPAHAPVRSDDCGVRRDA